MRNTLWVKFIAILLCAACLAAAAGSAVCLLVLAQEGLLEDGAYEAYLDNQTRHWKDSAALCLAEKWASVKYGGMPEEMADGVLDERSVVFHVEKMVFADVKGAPELLEPLCEKRAVLCCEVGSGVIPIDYETRLGRETVGRLCVRLAQRAECVVRMVCGIPTVIKGELPCRSI